MLPTRDPPQNKRPTQNGSEELETDMSSKWTGKKAGIAMFMSHNRLQTKGHKKKHRRTLNNTQGKNPSRRHKHCKYIHI